ncbi:MAG: hypothetical protein MUP26_02575, partial [Desulfobulbaceae bacterium]|nr:hypothetical protein [Desulfobulbaceae bacterium]
LADLHKTQMNTTSISYLSLIASINSLSKIISPPLPQDSLKKLHFFRSSGKCMYALSEIDAA